MKRSAADRAQSALPNAISASLAVLAIASFAGAVSGCSHSPPMRYVTLSAVTAPTPPARGQINPVQLTRRTRSARGRHASRSEPVIGRRRYPLGCSPRANDAPYARGRFAGALARRRIRAARIAGAGRHPRARRNRPRSASRSRQDADVAGCLDAIFRAPSPGHADTAGHALRTDDKARRGEPSGVIESDSRAIGRPDCRLHSIPVTGAFATPRIAAPKTPATPRH